MIRGLKSNNNNFYSGPNIVKKEIYRILNVHNYKDLQDIVDKRIQIIEVRNHQNILCSTRVGLKPKYEDYLKNGKYIYKLHRFITYAENKKHNFKEKENVNKYNQKDNKTS